MRLGEQADAFVVADGVGAEADPVGKGGDGETMPAGLTLARAPRSSGRGKLNAIADGLADLMEQLAEERPELGDDLRELREAVGLEQHEGTGPPRR
jgi:hypothetical protein